MNGKTIVIVGGGVGGIVASNELRRRLPSSHRVVVVEKNETHAFAPSFLWVMTGDRKPENVSTQLRSLLRPGVELVHGEVTMIDTSAKFVSTSNQVIQYDYLILALGAELAPEIIPGLPETAYSFYSFHEAQRLHRALSEFRGGTIALVVGALPYKCPGAPHEGAMLIADYFKRQGMRQKVQIRLYTPEPQPMAVGGPQLGKNVVQMLESKGITFYPLHKIVSVNPQSREIFFEGKGAAHFDLLVAIPPHRAPGVARQADLANDAGWIPVDRRTLETKQKNVYAIGDITAINIPGRWKSDVPMMLPKAGVFAHVQAEVVAKRIAAEIHGRLPNAEFYGDGYCMLEAGEGQAGFAFGDFFAEPSPKLELRNLGRMWHFGKVLFEKWWLSPFGPRKSLLRTLLKLGARILKIPASV